MGVRETTHFYAGKTVEVLLYHFWSRLSSKMYKIRYFFKNIHKLDGTRCWFERTFENKRDAFRWASEYESRGCIVEVSWNLSETA